RPHGARPPPPARDGGARRNRHPGRVAARPAGARRPGRRPRPGADEARRGRRRPGQHPPDAGAGRRAHGTRGPMQDWFGYCFYEATYWVSMSVMTLGFSLRTEGRQHIPKTGPALLVANHQSFIDPILVGLSTHRHLCFLARKTLFEKRWLRTLIQWLN